MTGQQTPGYYTFQCLLVPADGEPVFLLRQLEVPWHGRSSAVRTAGGTLFAGDGALEVGRYHSLCCADAAVPADLRVTASTDDGVVMAVEHRALPLWGVQFHPESILTADAGGGLDLVVRVVEAALSHR